MQMHTHTHTHPSCCCRCFFSSLHDFCLPLACWEALFCRTFLENRLGEASLENVFPKRCKSLIREPSLPCRSAARAWRSASAARSLHDVLWAFSAATLVSSLRWLYSVLRRVMSCGGAFFKLRQASSWTDCRLHWWFNQGHYFLVQVKGTYNPLNGWFKAVPLSVDGEGLIKCQRIQPRPTGSQPVEK